jgi:hypothetical protein
MSQHTLILISTAVRIPYFMLYCVVYDITVYVLQYFNVVCLVVSGAAHANLRGVDFGHNSAESLQAVIDCEHICGYF